MTRAPDEGLSSVLESMISSMPPKGWRKYTPDEPKRAIERHFRPRPDLVDVGNKLTDHVRISTNVYGRKRKPLHEET